MRLKSTELKIIGASILKRWHFLIVIAVTIILFGINESIWATKPTIPPLDQETRHEIEQLSYSDSENDIKNLKRLFSIIQEKVSFASEDAELVSKIILSYPKELLLNYLLLDENKRFRARVIPGDIQIIKDKNIIEISPYLSQYLKDEKNFDSNYWSWHRYCLLLAKLKTDVAKEFFRDKIEHFEQYRYTPWYGNIKLTLSKALSMMQDRDSVPLILKCAEEDFKDDDSYEAPWLDAYFKIFISLGDHSYIGFLLEKDVRSSYLRKRIHECYIPSRLFPDFILERDYKDYFRDIIRWREWYRNNKENLIWSNNLQAFIRKGREDIMLRNVRWDETTCRYMRTKQGNE